jgi:MFS family permease
MSRPRTRASGAEKRFLAVLGLPALALSLSVTTVSSFLPIFIQQLSGPLLTGALIGTEGVMALIVPTLVGSFSDRLRTPLGGRLPILMVAAPLAAAALVVLPLASSLLAVAPVLVLFYASYFAFFAPYFALYPDLVPDRLRGRSQGSMGIWREVGLGLALVGGGVLLELWRPLPFLIAAAVFPGVTALFVIRVARRREAREDGGGAGEGQLRDAAALALLRENPALRRLLAANALWETALNVIRAFVLLFFTVGLGRSASFASLVLAIVAVVALIAAPLAGTLADRMDPMRLVRAAVLVYGIGAFAPMLTQAPPVIAAVPIVGFAAAIVMTLPYSLVMGVLPDDHHGAAAGLFGLSRGVGLLLGPLLGGLAVTLLDGVLTGTRGYAAIFGVAGVALLTSLLLLPRRALEPPAS